MSSLISGKQQLVSSKYMG